MIVGPLSPDGPDTACTEELLYYNELAIFARAGHPLAKPDTAEATLAIADLAGQQWILPPRGTAPRSQLENAFRRAGLDPPASAVETSSMSCVRALLLATDRLTVLPAQIVRMEREMGLVSVLPVKWQAPSRPIGITARLRGTLSEAASAFIGCLHETAQQGGEVEVPPP